MTTVIQPQSPPDLCEVCNKRLQSNEGYKSSTGVVVCSDGCRKQYMKKHIPVLTVYSRVTGYCTPVSSWNKGKIKEFKDRRRYSLQQ